MLSFMQAAFLLEIVTPYFHSVFRHLDARGRYVGSETTYKQHLPPTPHPPQHTKDFVSQQSQQGWADACKRVRYKTLPDTSHHTLLESGADYLEIIDDFLNEYD